MGMKGRVYSQLFSWTGAAPAMAAAADEAALLDSEDEVEDKDTAVAVVAVAAVDPASPVTAMLLTVNGFSVDRGEDKPKVDFVPNIGSCSLVGDASHGCKNGTNTC